jgi:hypothetical protein
MSDAPPAAGRTAELPIGLDVERKYIQGEGARPRNCKPAARVELPDRVPAWAIGNYSLARQLLADPRVSRSAPALVGVETRRDPQKLAAAAVGRDRAHRDRPTKVRNP